MLQQFFVTGTDTNIGKTHITLGLLKYFNQNKFHTAGIKPLASGCDETINGRRNQDALILQEHSSLQLPYEEHNFIALSKPISPNFAAENEHIPLSVELLQSKYNDLLNNHCNNLDILLIEGIGGWMCPLNPHETMADFVKAIDVKIILVVGMKLGCLNHTLLTLEAMKNQSASLSGWIANCIDPDMESLQENINFLTQKIPAPLLGIAPFGNNAENYINFEKASDNPTFSSTMF